MLPELPADSVDCIVTSPPYWRQRDYRGGRRQVGQEKTPEEYVARLPRDLCRVPPRAQAHRHRLAGDWRQVRRRPATRPAVARGPGPGRRRLDPAGRLHLAQAQRHALADQVAADDRPRIRVLLRQVGPDYYYDADAIREPHVTFSREEPDARRAAAFRCPRRHARKRQKRRRKQPARRPLGPGLSPAGPQQADGLVDPPFQVPRGPFRGLPGVARRSCASRPAARRRASCSIRSSAAAPPPPSPAAWAGTTSASTARGRIVRSPGGGWLATANKVRKRSRGHFVRLKCRFRWRFRLGNRTCPNSAIPLALRVSTLGQIAGCQRDGPGPWNASSPSVRPSPITRRLVAAVNRLVHERVVNRPAHGPSPGEYDARYCPVYGQSRTRSQSRQRPRLRVDV